MGIEAGMVFEGKVTGITGFGAFVSLPERRSGLVHISEVANTYVSDVNQFLQLGQVVKVLVLSITEDGKINLSIKKAEGSTPLNAAQEPREGQPPRRERISVEGDRPPYHAPRHHETAPPQIGEPAPATPSAPMDFEERLKQFMKESDSRIADNRLYAEHRQRRPRR